MTHLEALRLFSAVEMAKFLAEQRMTGVEALLNDAEPGLAAEMRDKLEAMFFAWLRKECEL